MTTGKAVSLSPVGSRILRVRVFNLADADARCAGCDNFAESLRDHTTTSYALSHTPSELRIELRVKIEPIIHYTELTCGRPKVR